MRILVESIRAEFTRYKALAEGAMGQLGPDALCAAPFPEGNSVAVIAWHISGNLSSRFTDFLTADGEKPWRHREEEFAARSVTTEELSAKWEKGWSVLLETLGALGDEDLSRTVTIRKQPLAVHEALLRSLAHVSYHVGQIVSAGRSFKTSDWRFLSIPPGQSEAYNQQPAFEKPEAHAARLGTTRT